MIRQRRSAKLLALLTAFVLIFAACGGDDDDDATAENPDESTPSTEDVDSLEQGGTVTFASDQEPTGWNVNTSNDSLAALAYMEAIVLPSPFIVQPDFTVELDENLMESAEQTSDDPQTIEYVIKEEAVWNDGTPVTVEDFSYNWEMQNGSNPDVDVASTTGYDQIESVEPGDDDKTVVVTFSQPFADWQGLFSNLMPAHILKDATGWNDSLDGENIPDFSAGPFQFSNYEPGANVTLVPNESYWGPAPLLDELVVRFGIDAPNVPAALENGEIDLAYPQPQIDLVQQVEALAPEIDSQINFGLSFEHIDFNFLNPHLGKLEVRQAIAFGLDREDLVARTVQQFDERGSVLNNRLWLTGQPEYQDNAADFAFDPEQARSLLEEAGYTEGSDGIYTHPEDGKLTLRISTTGGNALRENTEEIIQSQLREVGIDIQIDNREGAEVFDLFFPESGNFEDANYDLALFAWVGTPFVVSSSKSLYECGGGQNEMSYCNEEIGPMFDDALAATDRQEAVDLMNQVDQLLWEDMATLPLYTKPTFLPYRTSVANIVDNPTNQGPLWNAYEWGIKAS